MPRRTISGETESTAFLLLWLMPLLYFFLMPGENQYRTARFIVGSTVAVFGLLLSMRVVRRGKQRVEAGLFLFGYAIYLGFNLWSFFLDKQ